MRKSLTILFLVFPVFYSCDQKRNSMSEKSTPSKVDLKGSENTNNQDSVTISLDKFIDTKYEFVDYTGKPLIIENSLPKGGQKYTDIRGKEYVYAIFWTQITNKMDSPFEVNVTFPADSFALPSSPGNYFKLFLPSEKMIPSKAPLFNFGLEDLNSVLNGKLQNPSTLVSTVNTNETFRFYVVSLFKEGVNGKVRAGMSLKNEKIYYSVNDLEILSGLLSFRLFHFLSKGHSRYQYRNYQKSKPALPHLIACKQRQKYC
jgi:hypothetical protein